MPKDKIEWLEWGKEAFERAKREGKPVILDIYGVWCHWCHQIEKNTYSDINVVRMVNEKFIPVRVDTDKRPDINERYNQGGWPSTVFLTADGRIITGVTYIGPREMLLLLHQVAEYHDINEGVVGDDRIKVEKPQGKRHFGITETISNEILEELITNFDIDYGGFGFEPKFPMPDAVEFLLIKYRKGKDKKLLKMATITLDWMIGNNINKGNVAGLLDNVEGGFFRYSVSRDWSIPHYEKMLETNAGLLANYLDTFQITKEPRYRIAVDKTIEYIKNVLSRNDGGFYGSQDADGEDDYYGRSIGERRLMETPSIDKTIYVNLNAMMVSAFIKAAIALGAEYCRELALETIDFLLKNCYGDNGMCHYYDGRANVPGLLTDNIYMIKALLDAYELTAERQYLEHAEKLAQWLKKLEDKDGVFLDRLQGTEDIGYVAMPNKPIIENSICAENFLRLGILLANDNYKKTAEKTLEAFVNARYGIHASRYGVAIEKFLDPIEIVVIGADHMPLLKHADGRRIVQALAENDALAKKKGYKSGIYVCKGMTCQRFETVEEAMKWLESGG